MLSWIAFFRISLISLTYILCLTAKAQSLTKEISIPSNHFMIQATSGTVSINRSDKVKDVVVTTNCSTHWQIHPAAIIQLAITHKKNGFAVLTGEDHKVYILHNSKGYEIPRDKINYCLRVPDDSQHKLKIVNSQLFIGTEKILPVSVKENKCPDEDKLDVTIPVTNVGDLLLRGSNRAKISLTKWKGGNVKIELSEGSSFKAGELEDIKKLELEVCCDSHAIINNVICDDMNIRMDHTTSLQIDGGRASKMKSFGSEGKVTLHGEFKPVN